MSGARTAPVARTTSSATKPLAGRTVLVTRPLERSAELVRALERRGATALVAPAIELVPSRSAALTKALRALANDDFDWITLTSPRTVEMLVANLKPREVRAKVAVVGEGTAEAFRRWARREPDLMPKVYTTLGLARAFPRGRGRVLCARADIAPEGLEDVLAQKGWSPERVEAYRTRLARSLPKDARDALRRGEVDAVTFTSASSVRGFVRALGAARGAPKVVCIGPVTAREARAHGFSVSAVASPHTVGGLVAALERAFRPRGGRSQARRA